jgi:hypothetical protein
MKCIIVFALVFVASAMAQGPIGHGPEGHQGPHYDDGPAHYQYGYNVKDPKHGVDYGHHENRDGALTKGTYFVALPDGRLQTVD